MLDPKIALKIAGRLVVVAEFPRNPEAVEAVAEDLIDLTRLCETTEAERRARGIVEEIRRTWDFWIGQSDLIRLYHRKFDPPREIHSEDNEAKNYGAKPKVACRVCNDLGAVKRDGLYGWCDCLAGVNLHFDFPDWLDVLNREERPRERSQEAPPLEPVWLSKTVSDEVEKNLARELDCPACREIRSHTHAEFWRHHCKQESKL